ncbi:MAG TPA: sigma-70 family RNA polymerase sigma factor [Gemmatimonadota bacterium]|nr:sigma-70 family RNA polymerase sigma factor [Gemmatimonadota bacterium]
MGDDELVAEARRGNARAFGRLVELHQPRLYGMLAKMTGDSELALDLSQEAFIRAWQGLEGFEGRATFSTWLYRIAVRLAYDARRDPRHDDPDALAGIADPAPGPDAHLDRSAEAEDLRRRIETLPDMQRAVVTLRTYNDLPYREIATILETSENSARVSFHHAIMRLKEGYLRDGRRQEAPTR